MNDVASVVDGEDSSVRLTVAGLGAKHDAAIGHPGASKLEGGAVCRELEAVRVLVAAGMAMVRARMMSTSMRDTQRIAIIRQEARQTVGKAKTRVGHLQQHEAAARAEAPAIEGGRAARALQPRCFLCRGAAVTRR